MKYIFIALFTILFLTCALSQKVEIPGDVFKGLLERVAVHYPQVKEEEREDFLETLIKHSEWHQKQNTSTLAGSLIVPYECTPFQRTLPAPTSVHEVPISWIDSIGAIGDSITAGFGAKGTWIFNMFTEFRGVSWDIGGDDDLEKGVLTIPNLIRKYNPNLKGFSTGTGGHTSTNAHCNQAESGAKCVDMLGQAQLLYNRMVQEDNFLTDFKLITIFIGGNDLCAACDDYPLYSKANYKANLQSAVDYIRDNFPRTILNIVPVLDVTELKDVTAGLCTLLHAFECGCGTADKPDTIQNIKQLQLEYVQAAKEIAAAQTHSDTFTIVIQPFMENTHVPLINGEPDMDFFALDCFHFSEVGHQAAAVALWNNINQKVPVKEDFWQGPKEQLLCPNPGDYIWTNFNS